MGIYGVGVDLVKTARLRQSYCAYGDRFLKRYLHPKEIAHFQGLLADDSVQGVTNQTQFLASRWAVKEATLKAFKSWRILFPDVYVDKRCSAVPPHVAAMPGLPPRTASPVVPVLAHSRRRWPFR
ncbi:hypothetical protein SPRG_06188 [Saprolegnia parasitica CBS 223.65]|uniref:4'-phosphopantetheinyl transferase domain-containing protein n=1 Tax=Saprolegnia parasitica (strain CBS 223.65) TaxID=695850 RepID=A0A067CNN8_SAPPC|nr:hypothetical protein SPRG_06188 [Saprolegnia parasitica CBS 223.65]KDO28141.1 hypothetical protein SPRG_06188 [Saprolegnia parasitica CBS 223.65]|eukprot:XP_012200968.1 hypothetical protein SPRG_06188 [Saprolegnia parasitica CBS 223.65]